jgi:hypothetical protein
MTCSEVTSEQIRHRKLNKLMQDTTCGQSQRYAGDDGKPGVIQM